MKYILILLIVVALILCGCRRTEPPVILEKDTTEASAEEGGELICLTDSPEEAARIAELYGISLIRYADGLALYQTDEDPQEVIRRGIEQGWPELSRNQTLYPY